MFWKKESVINEDSFEAKMKIVTDYHEVNIRDYHFEGGITEVDASTDCFELTSPAVAKQYQGNKQFVLRIIVDKNITQQELHRLTQNMVDKYFEKHKQFKLYVMTFRAPGTYTYSRDTVVPNKVEIRLYCRFHEDKDNA